MKPDTIVLHTTDQEFQDGHLFTGIRAEVRMSRSGGTNWSTC